MQTKIKANNIVGIIYKSGQTVVSDIDLQFINDP